VVAANAGFCDPAFKSVKLKMADIVATFLPVPSILIAKFDLLNNVPAGQQMATAPHLSLA
jgi:hypothetical protein